MKTKFLKSILMLLLSTSLVACSDSSDEDTVTETNSGTTDNSGTTSNSGKVGEWFSQNTYITVYEKSGDYPWPISQYQDIENGYYKCAPSYGMITDYLYGTCYEIEYNGKTIKVIGDDECPDGANTWIDLEMDGFNTLTGLTTGKPNAKIREIPYYTNKELAAIIKPGSNKWFLGCWVFNGRYPVTKVELSNDNKTFHAMKSFNERNQFWELQCPDGEYANPLYIRVTDKYNHTVVGKITNIADGAVNKLGSNFEY